MRLRSDSVTLNGTRWLSGHAQPHPVVHRRQPHRADDRRDRGDARAPVGPPPRRSRPRIPGASCSRRSSLSRPLTRGAGTVGEEPVVGPARDRAPHGDAIGDAGPAGVVVELGDHREGVEQPRPAAASARARCRRPGSPRPRPTPPSRAAAPPPPAESPAGSGSTGPGTGTHRAPAQHADVAVAADRSDQVGGVAVERADRLRDLLQSRLGAAAGRPSRRGAASGPGPPRWRGRRASGTRRPATRRGRAERATPSRATARGRAAAPSRPGARCSRARRSRWPCGRTMWNRMRLSGGSGIQASQAPLGQTRTG